MIKNMESKSESMVIFGVVFFQFHEMKLKKKLLRQTVKITILQTDFKKADFFWIVKTKNETGVKHTLPSKKPKPDFLISKFSPHKQLYLLDKYNQNVK